MSYLDDYLQQYYDEVDYKTFYRNIFPSGSLQKKGDFEQGKYNGIIVEVTSDKQKNGKPKVLRHTLTDDLEKLDEVVLRDNFCLMSPISYAGKTRDTSMARELYALAFDVDDLISTEKNKYQGIAELFWQIENTDNRIPKPTYVVSSGTGLHVYYVFEKPLPLFKNVLEQLEVYKRRLTWYLWHDSISNLHDDIQYEPVCQGFRLVGTITKNGERVRAFNTGNKVTMEYMNSFYGEEYQVKEFSYKSELTLNQAKNKYPEWYQTRIVDKKAKNTWQFNRRVYDKWLERIKTEYSVGHRFWCTWVLAVTAMKCGISLEELEHDAFELIDVFNKKENPFTKEDVLAALEGYDSAWMTYPIEKMSYRSDIPLIKNKRNGRKQSIHLEIARSIKKIIKENEGLIEGRPSKYDVVHKWKQEHPEGSKAACIRETGLSKPTVYKWWSKEPNDFDKKPIISSTNGERLFSLPYHGTIDFESIFALTKPELTEDEIMFLIARNIRSKESLDSLIDKIADSNLTNTKREKLKIYIESTQFAIKNLLKVMEEDV